MRAPLLSSSNLLALALLVGVASPAAHASLGGRPSAFAAATAVQARQMAAVPHANGQVAASAGYSVNETTLEGGTVVREYVDGGGQVFGVSWNGPFLPDLRELLGQHFTVLTAQPRKGRRPLNVSKDDLVIESGGHMRAWSGRAWLASALPAGVTAEVIE